MTYLQSPSLSLFQNAFLQVLSGFGFDFFKILMVDPLHDFKLGLWKDFSIHIIRILESLGSDKVQTFNKWCAQFKSHIVQYQLPDCHTSFCQVPVFGETTIHRFEGDVSEMKRLAGHDFEELLQVSWHLATSGYPLNLGPGSV